MRAAEYGTSFRTVCALSDSGLISEISFNLRMIVGSTDIYQYNFRGLPTIKMAQIIYRTLTG